MNYGARPCKIDHRDYDIHKTFGVVSAPTFPDSYDVDLGIWQPNQNAYESVFNNQAQPFGCTNYTSSDICANQDGELYNPAFLELYSHANQNGGYDIRQSLLLTIKQGTQDKYKSIQYRTAVFNVKPHAPLDAFDSIRYAMLAGLPEKRAVSIGTPWYREWENNAVKGISIMPAPVTYDPDGLGWHNWLIIGWKQINGITYLIGKTWQGDKIGDKGWLYFPREVINSAMSVSGSCTFTVTSMGSNQPIQRITTTMWQFISSFIRNFLKFSY